VYCLICSLCGMVTLLQPLYLYLFFHFSWWCVICILLFYLHEFAGAVTQWQLRLSLLVFSLVVDARVIPPDSSRFDPWGRGEPPSGSFGGVLFRATVKPNNPVVWSNRLREVSNLGLSDVIAPADSVNESSH